MPRWTAIGCAVLAAGCAGPVTQYSRPAPADVAAARADLQRAAVAHHLDRHQRLQDLAWPLLAANAALCGPRTALRTGLFLTDTRVLAALTPGLDAAAITALGLGAPTTIPFVIAGSPAAAAGVRTGERIVQINARTVPPDAGAHTTAGILNGALKQKPEVALVLAAPDGSTRRLSVGAVPVCAVPIVADPADGLNAFASSRRIAVLAGMERTLPDDLIQIVLGHELAHWLLRHPEKSTRNAWLSGGVLVGAVAGSLGAAADTTARWLGRRPPVSYARNGSALATYPYGREFEREADYVGLYLAARAGVPVVQAEALFQRFAVEHPINTVHSLSHPVTPERLLAVRAAAAEIAARQAAGEPLIPNGWSLPDGHSQRP